MTPQVIPEGRIPSRRNKSQGRALAEMFRLTFSDLRHDRILHGCTILALAGIVAPLLLLTQLKYSYIEGLRDNLRNNPRHLEIRPRQIPGLLSPDWFSRYQANPDTDFLIPSVVQVDRGTAYAMTLLRVGSNPEGPGVVVDPVATADGDPLLRWHGIPVPLEGQCVLSEEAAEEMRANVGDGVEMRVKRAGGDVSRPQVVIGVVPRSTIAKSAILLPLEVTERIRLFKYGFAVPEYDWPGGNKQVSPVYSQLVVLTRSDFPESAKYALQSDTGFSKLTSLKPDEVLEITGITPAEGSKAFLLETVGRPGAASNVKRVVSKLGGNPGCILVSNPSFEGTLAGSKGPVSLTVRSLGIEQPGEFLKGAPALPEWTRFGKGEAGDLGEWIRTLAVPREIADAAGDPPWTLQIGMPNGLLSFPVTIETADHVPEGSAMVPFALGGIVRSGQRAVGVKYRAEDGIFIVDSSGYQSLRLFAKTPSGVSRLVESLENEGIASDAEIEEIESIERLDFNLGKLIDIISLVIVGGGASALAGGLLISIERKKREFGLLRLYGVPSELLVFVIVLQAAAITWIALSFSIGLSCFFQWLAPRYLGLSLEATSYRPDVPVGQFTRIAAGGMLISFCVSILTSMRILKIEPADSIRWR